MITPAPTRGYTLLELIVSIGIFSIIMLAVTGAYLTLINLERKARAVSDLNSNLAFTIDGMSRTVRTGKNYACPSGGNGTCSELSFTDSQNQQVTYLLKSDGSIGQCIGGVSCTSSNATSLTDPRITIETLTFYVRGVGADDAQPRVTFTVRGGIQTEATKRTNFTIQGAASQRLIDL